MFEEVLSRSTKESLALLGKSGILNDAYMAGGTALALQIGHRFSRDFDFFSIKEFDEDLLTQRIKELMSDFKLEKTEWRTIMGNIKKTRFSLFFYNYPLLFKTHNFLGVEIADVKDIAPMKIAAISDRGAKRDFIDLYFLIKVEKILSLAEALRLYEKKFKLLKQNKMHILKSLRYFEDADGTAMPKMIKNVSWREVKKFFEGEIKKISEETLFEP